VVNLSFGTVEGESLKGVRTVRIDTTTLELQKRRLNHPLDEVWTGDFSDMDLNPGVVRKAKLSRDLDGWESDDYSSLIHVRPRCIIIKIGFHDLTYLPRTIPPASLSRLDRVIYVITYTTWDRDLEVSHGPGKNHSCSANNINFGISQWIREIIEHLPQISHVDFVFWTQDQNTVLHAPNNKWARQYGSRHTTKRWVDEYIKAIGATFQRRLPKTMFTIVNAGALEWWATKTPLSSYEEMEDYLMAQLLAEAYKGKGYGTGTRPEEVIRCMIMKNRFRELKESGVERMAFYRERRYRDGIASPDIGSLDIIALGLPVMSDTR
jgi:hypothetical protein